MLRSAVLALRHRLVQAKDQSGQAMLIVLAAIALMATIPLVVVDTTANQLPLTSENLDWNAAYEAAQAGLNDYIQQIDANSTYTEYNDNNGNPTYSCTAGKDINAAFCFWASSSTSSLTSPTPVSTNPDEWYQYSVTTNTGKVLLTVSGMAGPTQPTSTNPNPVGNIVRTFRYQLGSVATLDDIYWTNSEDDGGIVFDSSDVLNGPVFSNDDFWFCGSPTFKSTIQSADGSHVGSPYFTQTCNGSTNYSVSLADQENIISNSTGPDVLPAQTLGCYINDNNGSTTTTFTLSGSTLTWSGGTLQNNSTNPNNDYNGSNICSSGSPITIADLQSALFYVNGGNVVINGGGSVNGYLTIVAAGTSQGNITLDGNITYPCADITYQSGGSCPNPPSAEGSDPSDALGLIAANNIYVSDNNAAITIDAAMMAINGSFENSYYTQSCGFGGCNTLTVFGSIAQNTRGAVGQESNGVPTNGYAKNYLYDTSLQTLWPPFFIPPLGATWLPQSYEECSSGASKDALASSQGC